MTHSWDGEPHMTVSVLTPRPAAHSMRQIFSNPQALKKKNKKKTHKVTVKNAYCFMTVSQLFKLWAHSLGCSLHCGYKDVQKTLHHTTAASQANIYWAPIIALFLHYYIRQKHTILGHGLCLLSVNVITDSPMDLGNYLPQISSSLCNTVRLWLV